MNTPALPSWHPLPALLEASLEVELEGVKTEGAPVIRYLKMSGVMATARIVIKRMASPLCGRRTPPAMLRKPPRHAARSRSIQKCL